MLVTNQLLVAIDIHTMEKHAMEVHGKPKTVCSLQNVTFCVQQKKETHTILEKLEGEQMMAEFKFSYWLDPFVCVFKCGINRRVN